MGEPIDPNKIDPQPLYGANARIPQHVLDEVLGRGDREALSEQNRPFRQKAQEVARTLRDVSEAKDRALNARHSVQAGVSTSSLYDRESQAIADLADLVAQIADRIAP